MYIQDKVEEYADEIFERLENGAVMYFCGLKGMMPGIQDARRRVRPRLTSLFVPVPASTRRRGGSRASPVVSRLRFAPGADAQGSVQKEGEDVRRLRRRPQEEGPVARRGLLSVAFGPALAGDGGQFFYKVVVTEMLVSHGPLANHSKVVPALQAHRCQNDR